MRYLLKEAVHQIGNEVLVARIARNVNKLQSDICSYSMDITQLPFYKLTICGIWKENASSQILMQYNNSNDENNEQRGKIFLLKVKSCNALFRILLVCISSYFKSVLKYKFFILGTHHPNTPNLREPSCMDPRLFFDAKQGPRANKFGKHRARPLFFTSYVIWMLSLFVGGGGVLEPLVILHWTSLFFHNTFWVNLSDYLGFELSIIVAWVIKNSWQSWGSLGVLCVSCDSQSAEQVFPWKTLPNWSLQWARSVFMCGRKLNGKYYFYEFPNSKCYCHHLTFSGHTTKCSCLLVRHLFT